MANNGRYPDSSRSFETGSMTGLPDAFDEVFSPTMPDEQFVGGVMKFLLGFQQIVSPNPLEIVPNTVLNITPSVPNMQSTLSRYKYGDTGELRARQRFYGIQFNDYKILESQETLYSYEYFRRALGSVTVRYERGDGLLNSATPAIIVRVVLRSGVDGNHTEAIREDIQGGDTSILIRRGHSESSADGSGGYWVDAKEGPSASELQQLSLLYEEGTKDPYAADSGYIRERPSKDMLDAFNTALL